MRISYLFLVVAVLSLIYGVGFVLLPEQLLSIYGITTDAGGLLFVRLFGATLIGFGVLAWFVRNADTSEARRAIVLALFALNAVSFFVLLLAQLAGTVNGLGWVNIAIYLLLALGFGYFLMPGSGEARRKADPSIN
jgi:hypothetical protein